MPFITALSDLSDTERPSTPLSPSWSTLSLSIMDQIESPGEPMVGLKLSDLDVTATLGKCYHQAIRKRSHKPRTRNIWSSASCPAQRDGALWCTQSASQTRNDST